MQKAFLIMQKYIDQALSEGNRTKADQGFAFLKERELIGQQAFSDITIKSIRELVCEKGLTQAMTEARNRLASRYADLAPMAVVAEKRGMVSAIQAKYNASPDDACVQLESDGSLELSIIAAKEAEIQRLQQAEAERIRNEKAARIKLAPKLMRDQWDTMKFCVNYGNFLRGKDFSDVLGEGKALEGVFAAEAKRRNLAVDKTSVQKEVIRMGMSECSLYASWGEPNDVNRSVGAWGVHKQHIYDKSQYVYTENGRIKSWQD